MNIHSNKGQNEYATYLIGYDDQIMYQILQILRSCMLKKSKTMVKELYL